MSQTIRRALLSVSNKEGLLEFARALRSRGVELLSTGGTAAMLREDGIEVRDVSDFTGFPEMLDGRVKTLHPRVHGGILGRGTDRRTGRRCVSTASTPSIWWWSTCIRSARPWRAAASFEEIIENIDIGGPAMVRSAAKNHERVAIVVDPARLRHGARRDRARGRQRLHGDPAAARDQGVRAHRAVRRGRRRLPRPCLAQRHPERIPGPAGAAVPQAPRPALRREPAPAGRVLRGDRQPGRVGGLGLATAGQGTLVQQPRRRGHRLRVRPASSRRPPA
jgi:hypothetical protein